MRVEPGIFVAVFGLVITLNVLADELADIPVESLERLPTQDFGDSISSAAAAGEVWVYDALQVALRLVGGFEGRSQSVTRTQDPEGMGRAEIVIIEDGYLDDSVRGARYQITLERDAEDVWRPILIQRGWRCWPTRGHETFARDPCA